MANHDVVRLNVSTKEQAGVNWKPATASNGATYWYKFSGGNMKDRDNGDQNGDDSTIADEFLIKFRRHESQDDELLYDFEEFWKDPSTDPDNQLSGRVNANKKTVRVTNECTKDTEGMLYGVKVSPVHTKITFLCHPVISNRQVKLNWIEKLVRIARRISFLFMR